MNALRKLYPTTAARLDDESRGVAIRVAGEPVADYEISHDKALHLIVVRTDGAVAMRVTYAVREA